MNRHFYLSSLVLHTYRDTRGRFYVKDGLGCIKRVAEKDLNPQQLEGLEPFPRLSSLFKDKYSLNNPTEPIDTPVEL